MKISELIKKLEATIEEIKAICVGPYKHTSEFVD